jgi:hypothetical protein
MARSLKILTWISFVSGLAAAGLWLRSAGTLIPDIDLKGKAPVFFTALQWQARLSAYAAILTAVSVIAQAFAFLARISNWPTNPKASNGA